ncbi:Rpn family recombination-promoting nuclease/putative transposase [Floridanema evergladense]|uniref:Rpn family recombination-promoting nuclease/putative transposase n=2 Tax=Floridaenema evergladense BLCC-F167 TaxID=3153639 RepID=A0ABV4WI46_9CYAN
MRRDSIFYKIFQQSPSLLFELIATPPTNASAYRFDSVAVKEPKFEIDGVFLPPETDSTRIIYFCEVQFQKDERLYERLFGEAFLYFYRNRERYSNWQAVVIYPTRSIEQNEISPYQALLNSEQVHRIYLQELGEIRQLPLGIALMVLTIVAEEQAAAEARYLIERAQEEVREPEANRAIIDTIATIMVYKFIDLSRQEVEAMLGLRLEESRVYREAKEEGRLEGRQEGRIEGRIEGQLEGQQQEAVNLVVRLLSRRFGKLSEKQRNRISNLRLSVLEDLGEALLDFSSLDDLSVWLDGH